ncbi:helix-turn-helix domain-containing protein [Flavitalea flava]
MENIIRQIIAYKRYFLQFYEDQPLTVQEKIEWVLNLIRVMQQVPEKYFKIQFMSKSKSVEVNKNITTFDQILDKKYGKPGGRKREIWEQNFETFRLGVMLEEARKKLNMTQEELAEKCGTNKAYISRIENNASDIRLSTLMKIIQQGLGGHLKLTLEF